jgi:hypothetical protein
MNIEVIRGLTVLRLQSKLRLNGSELSQLTGWIIVLRMNTDEMQIKSLLNALIDEVRSLEMACGFRALPYHFLGPCSYVSHTGSRPISITWKLQHHVPPRLLQTIARQVAV